MKQVWVMIIAFLITAPIRRIISRRILRFLKDRGKKKQEKSQWSQWSQWRIVKCIPAMGDYPYMLIRREDRNEDL